MHYLSLESEIALAVAAVTSLLGAWLCWTAPRHRMSVEERAKDGHLTEDEARRSVRVRAKVGPALVIGGLVVIGGVLLF